MLAVSQPCKQFWTFTYTAGSPACSLTGSYSVTFDIACTDAANCPLNSGETSSIAFGLNSGSFCGTITPINVGASTV